MGAAKYNIKGSGYVGAFATANDSVTLVGIGAKENVKHVLSSTLKTRVFEVSVSGTDLVGVFARANSNGILLPRMIEDYELSRIKELGIDIRIGTISGGLNAVGNNIIANDRIAIANPDYDHRALVEIRDVLGVEVVRHEIGGFKTVGANNILTNSGFIVNNRTTDEQKEALEQLVGLESVRTTVNTGSLYVGLSSIANSSGVVVGDETTGYELARVMDGLNIKD